MSIMNTYTDNIVLTREDFGNALKDIMRKRELSYNQLSYKCGLSGQYLNQIVNRKSLPPKDENLIKIAKALEIEPEYFFEYRLRILINLLNDAREYLDPFLKEIKSSQKKRVSQKARVSSRKAAKGIGRVGKASKQEEVAK